MTILSTVGTWGKVSLESSFNLVTETDRLFPEKAMDQKFNLKWNDFQENISASFATLRGENDFADVTLACADGQQVEAHKVILASTSPFFQDLLKRNSHPHPLIFMRGVSFEEMVAVVDFLYNGEVNILQEHLDGFLAIAEDLKLKGLRKRSDFTDVIKDDSPKPNRKTNKKERKTDVLDFSKDQIPAPTVNPDSTIDAAEYKEKLQSMMEKSEKTYLNGARRAFYKICKVCGKEGTGTNIKGHIETNHLQGVSIPCNFCDEMFVTRNSLKQHKNTAHGGNNGTKEDFYLDNVFKAEIIQI